MRKAFRPWFALIPVGALLAILSACGDGDYGGNDDAGAPAAVDQPADGDNAQATGASGGDVSGSGDVASQDFGRKVVRTATINLAIDDLDDALASVRTIASGAGGFVATSDILVDHSEDTKIARPERATVTLRVPAAQFDATLQHLRDAAHGVDAENIGSTEVTAEYTDLQSRLRNLKAAEAQYVVLLDRAQSIDEIIRVQQSVDTVRGQIEEAQGRLNVLDDQVDLATITVNLRLLSAPIQAESDFQWVLDALTTSVSISLGIGVLVGIGLVAGAVFAAWAVPLALVTILAWKRFGGVLTALARRIT